MDRNGQKSNSIRTDDTSLGLLNMDSLKGRGRFFGDLSHDSIGNRNASASNGGDRRISDRLNMERKKALEALQKSDKSDLYRRSPASSNKENIKSALNSASRNGSMPLDRTDYVPLRRPHTINISDLVTDETINLETTSCPPSAAKDAKISFEPSEMTGRSTLYKKDMRKYHCNPVAASLSGVGEGPGNTKTMSVNDILASSFAQKARNLCDTLNGGDCSLNITREDLQLPGLSLVSSSTACSSFNNYNNSKSLPRTADLSLSKASCSQLSFTGNAAGTFSFNCGAAAGDESDISSENFAPGELMQSKLIMDEISWAQEYAAIPTSTLSQQAKAKAAERNSQVNTIEFEPPSASNSIIAGDPNFSVGNFFHMRSENIWDIVKSKSPDKCRTPFALVDEDDTSAGTDTVSTSSIQMEAASCLVNTPKVDNKTYTRVSSQINACQESKDSGNSSDNSYLLSVSAIDKALTSLQRDSCISGYGNSDQLLMLTKKSKSCINPPQLSNTKAVDAAQYTRSKGNSLSPDIKLAGARSNLQAVSEIILENKENLDPEVMRGCADRSDLSDTLSFTESILNSSDMKQMQLSHSQQRSPLSPIEVRSAPNIRITEVSDGEEADNDEWPGTPVQNPNRRIRRTKSPHNKTPLSGIVAAEESPDATTPVNSRPSRSYVADQKSTTADNNSKVPKSLCSTRLDGDRNDCDFGISPNLSASKTSVQLGRNNTLTNASPANVNLENSPLSTTSRRYQLASPTPTNLDTTSNSDRQLLAAGDAHKVASSPVGSESSSTCSYATMHGTRSATTRTMRSISRCSSTSEFSHRDGKPIPLKVTAFELSWGSVKLRSDARKSMQIKNIISKRLVIRVEISGPGFQIVNNQRSNNITLHSQECRTINISFCPTVPGVAIGKLSFFAPTGAHTICQSFIDVPLYAYGGNANVVPQKVTVGPVGSPFITMGDICELAHPLQRTVRFHNKGSLLAFAVITADSLGLMLPRISDAFEIQPQKVLIPSRSSVDVQILFKPKREEIKKILKKTDNVLALATMRVISGDEANRQRIRRLLAQMNERERSKMSSSALDMLWTPFSGEEEMKELADIHESPNIAMDLTSSCRVHEIVLTINRENFDETAEASSLFLPDGDETLLFRTVICAADSNSPTPPTSLGTVNEMYEENTEEVDHGFAAAADKKASWSVKPSFVKINCKRPEYISLFVHNGFKSRQYFEVACSNKNLLRFSPSEGYVAPDNGQTEVVIEVNVNAARDLQEDVFIIVNMENERIMVPVKIQ